MNENVRIQFTLELSQHTYEHIAKRPEVIADMTRAAEKVLYKAVLKALDEQHQT